MADTVTPDVKTGTSTETEQTSETESSLQPLFNVIMLNDEITTMDFVVKILMTVFRKNGASAVRLMYQIHYTGSAHVATMPLDRAEKTVNDVHTAATAAGYPLRCTLEPAI